MIPIITSVIALIFSAFAAFTPVSYQMFGATVLFPTGGGTGTSTIPTYGKVLVGNANGRYDVVATSSLGITSGGTPASPNTSIQFNDGGSFGGSKLLYTEPSATSLQVKIQDQANADTQGNDLTIQGSTGKGNASGGAIFAFAGDTEATVNDFFGAELGLLPSTPTGQPSNTYLIGAYGIDGDGGILSLIAGSTVGTDKNGGAVSVEGGSGTGNGNGGDIILKPGDYPGGSGQRGRIFLPYDSTNNWNEIVTKVQDQQTNNVNGDDYHLQGANGLGSGSGGRIRFLAGDGGATGDGGDFQFNAGNGGATSGNGGIFELTAGNAGTGSNGNGGSLSLAGGVPDGLGTTGHVRVRNNTSSPFAIFDTSLLSSSDKTFSFPNLTGTFVIASTTLPSGYVGFGTSTPAFFTDWYTNATTSIRIDSGSTSQGGCLVMKDRDGSGYTYLTVNNGTLTASTNSCL